MGVLGKTLGMVAAIALLAACEPEGELRSDNGLNPIGAETGAKYTVTFEVGAEVDSASVTATLTPGVTASEVDASSGNSLLQVALPGDDDEDEPIAATVTANDLIFEFVKVPAGTYTLDVSATLKSSSERVGVQNSVTVTADVALGLIEFAALGQLTGEATNTDGSEISLTLSPGDRSTTTDSNDRYTFTDVPAGDYTLRAEAEGHAPVEVALSITANQTTQAPDIALQIGDSSTTQTVLAGGSVALTSTSTILGTRDVEVQLTPATGATQYYLGEAQPLAPEFSDLSATTLTYTFTEDGFKKLWVKYRDDARNESEWASITFRIDTVLPSDVVVATEPVAGYASSRTISLSIGARGASTMRFATTETGLADADWIAFSGAYNGLSLPASAPEGDYVVWYQMANAAGLPSAAASIPVKLSLNPRDIATISMNGGATQTRNRTNAFSFTLTAGVAVPTQMQMSCNGTDWSSTNFDPASPVSIDITSAAAGCAVVGNQDLTRTHRFRVVDHFGRTGTVTTLVVRYDPVAPSAPVITSPADGAFVASTMQTLVGSVDFSATGETAGTIRIQNTALGEVTDNLDAMGNFSVAIQIAANAQTELEVNAFDEAGNPSSAVNWTLTNDSVAPTVTSIVPELTADSIKLFVNTNEPVELRVDYGTATGVYTAFVTETTFATSNNITIPGLVGDTIYYYQVTATDQAGNPTIVAEDSAHTYIDATASITLETTWDETATDYYVSQNFVVSNTSLTIMPGVTIRMAPGVVFRVQGVLRAEGTSAQPITFTSSLASPSPGDWGRIEFVRTPLNLTPTGEYLDGGSVLRHVNVAYGGGDDIGFGTTTGAVSVGEVAGVFFENVSITDSETAGMYVYNSGAGSNDVTANNVFFVSSKIARAANGIVSDPTGTFDDTVGLIKVTESDFIDVSGGWAIDANQEALEVSFCLFDSDGTGHGVRTKSVRTSVQHSVFVDNVTALQTDYTSSALPDSGEGATFFSNTIIGVSDGTGTAISESNASSDVQQPIGFHRSTVTNTKTAAAIFGNKSNHFSAFGNNFGPVDNAAVETALLSGGDEAFATVNPLHMLDLWWTETIKLNIQNQLILDWVDSNFRRQVNFEPFLTRPAEAPLLPVKDVSVMTLGAGDVDLSWVLSPELDVAGYYVYYSTDPDDLLAGTGATEGASKIDASTMSCSDAVGATETVRTCTLNNLTVGQTYYFAVTSFDNGGNNFSVRASYPSTQNLNLVGITGLGIDTTTSEFTVFYHGLLDGQLVEFPTTAPGGLATSTTYCISVVDQHRFSLQNAACGAAETVTSATGTYELTTVGSRSAQLTRSGITGLSPTDFVLAANAVEVPNNQLRPGEEVVVTSSGDVPMALSPSQNYYVHRRIQLDIPTVHFTVESTGTLVLTNPNSYFADGMELNLTTTGGLPSDLDDVDGDGDPIPYYVVNATGSNFNVSLSEGGTPVSIGTDDDSGSHAFNLAGQQANVRPTAPFVLTAAATPLTVVNPGGYFQDNMVLRAFTTDTLPTGVATGTDYFVVNATPTEFQIATSLGGTPENAADDDVGVGFFQERLNTVIQLSRTPGGQPIAFDPTATVSAPAPAAAFTLPNLDGQFVDGMMGRLTTSGSLPTGVATATDYYVVNSSPNSFQLAATPGGVAITVASDDSGDHTFTLEDRQGSGAIAITPVTVDATAERTPYQNRRIKMIGHESWYGVPVSVEIE